MTVTTDKPATEPTDEPGGFRHSRRTLAAGLVLLVAGAGGVWAATAARDSGGKPTPAAYGSACGLTGGDTAAPTAGPAVQWQNLDGAWLPVSATQGPGRRSATGAWSCFAHTPTGAVLAAWTISNRMGVAPDFAGLIKQQTVPGPGQAIQLKQGQVRPAANDQVTPYGFDINSYDHSAATVTFYARKHGVSARCASTVQWVGGQNGDWLLQLNTDGSPASDCEQVSPEQHPAGFLSWGPNS